MRFGEVLISSLRFIFNASHNIIIGYRNCHIYARTHRSRVLWPQPFVKVQWLGVGEALASKTPSRSWFLGETWVLFISHINSSMALPLSKCVHFLSIFLSSAGWISLLLGSAEPSTSCLTGSTDPSPSTSFLASKIVLLLSFPPSLSFWVFTFSPFLSLQFGFRRN